jgi:transposase
MEKENVFRKRRKFDVGFKTEALKMVSSGRSISEVAHTLGIGENLLYNWRVELIESQSPDNQMIILENEQLRKQLRQAETERDLLKKVISILSPKT